MVLKKKIIKVILKNRCVHYAMTKYSSVFKLPEYKSETFGQTTEKRFSFISR